MAMEIDHFPGRTLEEGDNSYLYFGGTAYLGLQTHPEFLEKFKKGLEVHGTTYAASRHSNVKLRPFEKGEQWLAQNSGAEKALYVSSGFAACQLVRKYLGTKGNALFFAPHTHAALLFPEDRVYKDLETLRNDLVRHIEENPENPPVLIFDTVDFAGSKPLQFDWLESLPLDQLILVADDSHAIGITGRNGGGSYRNLKSLRTKELLVVGSLGKGFAIGGGFLLGKAKDLIKITQDPWFGGSGPGTPAGLEVLRASEGLLENQREILQKNIQLFQSLLHSPHHGRLLPPE